MTREFEKYIPEIQVLNLQKDFDKQKLYAAGWLGSWALNTSRSPKRVDAAKRYLESDLKHNTELVFAAMLKGVFARRVAGYISRVENIYPEAPGLVEVEVGFSPERMVKETKIRTLKSDANAVLNLSPFSQGMWHRDRKYLKALKIEHPLVDELRAGWDEAPQLTSVINGEMSLVSPRGYLLKELEGTEVLRLLKDEADLGFSGETKGVLANHCLVMHEQGVKPGIINPRAALNFGMTSPLLRLFLDMRYAENANPLIDMRIGILGIMRREREFIAVSRKPQA